MLALDTTLHCIEAEESDVIAVFQSQAPVTIAVAGLNPTPCEAYVCAVRKQGSIQVYAALVTNRKKALVYKPTFQPEDEFSVARALREGVSFAEGMGFTMESVNLNYSPAMRAVVVRNISILRTEKKREIKEKSAGTAAEPVVDEKKAAIGAQNIAAGKSDGKTTDILLLKKNPPSKGQKVTSIDDVAAIIAELTALREEKEHNEAVAAEELLEARGELSQLITENIRFKDRIAEVQSSASQLLEDLAKLQEQLATARSETVAVTQAKDSAASAFTRQIGDLKEKVSELSVQLVASGEARKADAASNLSLQTNLASMAASQESLILERDQLVKELAALRAEQEILQARQKAFQKDTDEERGLRRGLDGEIDRLREENRLLQLERSVLVNQKSILLSANDHAEARASALLAERDALSDELAALREQVEQPFAAAFQLMEEIGEDESAPESSGEAETDLRSHGEADVAPCIGFLDEDNGHLNHFSPFGFGADGSVPVTFRLQKDLSAIPYQHPDDILSLMHSVNTARVTPEGELPGNGKAYICSVRRGESVEIAVALQILDTGRVVLYHPEHQPEDPASAEKILHDAVIFSEMVGFLMEPNALDEGAGTRASVLSGIPVLKQVG